MLQQCLELQCHVAGTLQGDILLLCRHLGRVDDEWPEAIRLLQPDVQVGPAVGCLVLQAIPVTRHHHTDSETINKNKMEIIKKLIFDLKFKWGSTSSDSRYELTMKNE